jgi:PIN domain nuclease of toxin-antitoxin system
MAHPSLSPLARRRISANGNEVLVSAASAWEIATKHRLGRLPEASELLDSFTQIVTDAAYTFLPISVEHALRAGRLPGVHRDPFDRMLAAQALCEDIVLLSSDVELDAFHVRREW